MTLGESLNNPLDIKHDGKTVWIGQSPDQPDATFVKFISPEYCYRAGAKILKSYAKRGIVTLQGAVYRWAPPADRNDTEAYVQHMCAFTGWSRGTPFMRDLLLMLKGLTMFEQGKIVHPDSIIAAGIALAQEPTVPDPVVSSAPDAGAVKTHVANNNRVYGGVLSGAGVASFIVSELHGRVHFDLNTAEIAALTLIASILLAQLFPKGVPGLSQS